MQYFERVVGLSYGFSERVEQVSVETQLAYYEPRAIASLSDGSQVTDSLTHFSRFYSGPIATAFAKDYISNAKALPPGEFVLSKAQLNEWDHLEEGISLPVYPFSSLASGSEGRFFMDGSVGFALGYKSFGDKRPYSLGFVNAQALSSYHREAHDGSREFPFGFMDDQSYDPTDLVIFQCQGQSLSLVPNENRREQTRKILEGVVWSQLLVNLLAEWADGVGCRRLCLIPAELGKWESKLFRNKEYPTNENVALLAKEQYEAYIRQYDGLAKKLGFVKNEHGLWERV